MTRLQQQRAAGFTCRVRKYRDEQTARRCLWAIGQQTNRPGRINVSRLTVKWCRLCEAWHIVRVK